MRGEFISEYQKLNPEDQKAFRRFFWVNAAIATTLLAGLIALAVNVPGEQSETSAQNSKTGTQTQQPLERASVLPSR
jgi:hypothetical protein